MTETEAKTKWCPYKAAHQATAIALMAEGSRKMDLPDSACIGSACMMWREHGPFSPGYQPKPHEIGGFCGLAGRP